MACLQRMQMSHEADMLHGVYVIGSRADVKRSCGVQMEAFMANVLDIPVYVEESDGFRASFSDEKYPETIEAFARED